MLKICSICKEEKELEKFSKNSSKIHGVNSECKLCKSKIDREYRKQNKHRLKEYFQKKYQEDKEKKLQQVNQWQENNRSKVLSYKSKWRAKNPSRCRYLSKKRANARLERTPFWLTKEQHNEIERFYELAILMTENTGEVYHVDHIVPLQGELVSGLHVPWNLQVITATENLQKSNKFIID